MIKYFLADRYLQDKIASPVSESHTQNYFHLDTNAELSVFFEDFSTCLSSNLDIQPVSFDGWTLVDVPTQYGHNWSKVIYAEGIGYVAIALDSDDGLAPGMVMTSANGTEWILRDTPDGGLRFWETIIYVPSKGLLVAGTQNKDGYNLATSTDGITWTLGTTGVITSGVPTVKDIIWSEDKQLYIGVGGFTSRIFSSPDLVTWTPGTATPYIDSPMGIAYSSSLGKFCIIDFYGIVYTSTDGISWTFLNTGWDSNWNSITWSNSLGMFCAFGEHHENYTNPHPFITSTDGITWTQRPWGFTLIDFDEPLETFTPAYGIRWDSYTSKFYAITAGDNNAVDVLLLPSMFLVESSDGITWTIDTTLPGVHEYPYPVFQYPKYRDIAFKSDTERVVLTETTVAYYTGT